MSEQKASRELDAMVAERVMGWTWQRFDFAPASHDGPNGHLLAPWRWLVPSPVRAGKPADGTETRFIGNVPHYSSDISAAMQVAERMIADGWRIYIDGPCSEEREWRVMFAKERGTEWEYGDTLAEAICLAALKAIEADFSTPTDEAR